MIAIYTQFYIKRFLKLFTHKFRILCKSINRSEENIYIHDTIVFVTCYLKRQRHILFRIAEYPIAENLGTNILQKITSIFKLQVLSNKQLLRIRTGS